ncbi:SLC13 family permease [Kocuria sp. CH-021]|uniref:SLC13 family permease n=1 Tax=Kocuria sp. CH-021 TaxID=3406735 RepID=UPI003C755227
MGSTPSAGGPRLEDDAPGPGHAQESDHRSPGERAPAEHHKTHRIKWSGLVAGLVLALLIYVLLPADLAQHARLTAATAGLMGVWWMTEAIPIPATALLPLIIFPVLAPDVAVDDVGASYGSNIIFLFMGGFLLALAMQRWNLHRRIALRTVRVMGTKPAQMVAGFMIATGFLSMWVSNTATAVMMIPIGVSVLLLLPNLMADAAAEAGAADTDLTGADPQSAEVKEAVIASNFGTALMLGIAYAASIGSLGTIIGTPPNTLMVGYLQEAHDITVGFGQWMLVGVPLSVVMLAIAWFLLTKVLFKPEIDEIPGGRKLIDNELHKLGPMSTGEKLVLAIFALAAFSWVFVPVIFDSPPISDAGIAMVVGLLLFLLPAGAERGVRLLDWESAVKLPWGVLLLFGGGLALSSQFSGSGLTEWIGAQVEALGAVPVLVLVLVVAAGVIFLTELTSNTATAATFLPVAGGVALGLDMDPMLLAIPVALAATCAFMLPVATPPNAIAFGSGYVTIGQMIRGGLWLNVVGVVLITLVTMTLGLWVFGIVY